MAQSVVLERLLPPAQRDVVPAPPLKRQRVYILPSRQGLILMLALITMLLGAVNYNNSMAYMLTFLLGSVFMVCMLHTHHNLAGLILSGATPQPVFVGDTAEFPVLIDNRDGPLRPALRFTRRPHGSPEKNQTDHPDVAVTINAPAANWQRFAISVPALRRGRLPLHELVISTRFPLGLFHAWSYLDLEQQCVVYPKPEGQEPLPPPAPIEQTGQIGARTGTNDFAGFRPYHPGDSIRSIAWKAMAREQPLLVKRFSGEGSHTLHLTWQHVGHLHDVELRLSQLCRWVLLAEQEGWTYGLEIPGHRIDPDQGPAHRNACLEALAHFGVSHAD